MEKPRSDVFPFLDRALFLCLGGVVYSGIKLLLLMLIAILLIFSTDYFVFKYKKCAIIYYCIKDLHVGCWNIFIVLDFHVLSLKIL